MYHFAVSADLSALCTRSRELELNDQSGGIAMSTLGNEQDCTKDQIGWTRWADVSLSRLYAALGEIDLRGQRSTSINFGNMPLEPNASYSAAAGSAVAIIDSELYGFNKNLGRILPSEARLCH